MKRVLALCSLLLFAWALAPLAAYAQNSDGSFNLVTSPLPINLKAKPGSTVVTDIRVKNGNTNTEKLKVTLMKFNAYGEEGKPGLADREAGDDYFDWVSFSPNVFEAPSNEWITIKMTINLPKSAAFGYYYAVIFSRADEAPKPQAKQSVLVGSTAVLVLLEADVPNAKRTANIVSFSVGKKSYEFLPAEFTVKIKNSGNIHLIPTGNIFISRGGKNVAILSVNDASGNVLPGSNRIFTTAWKDGFPSYVTKEAGGKIVNDDKGKPVKSLTWDISKINNLRFGHYTARLLLAYDDGVRDVPLEASLSFWVIPWRIIGGALVIFALVITGLWSNLKKIYIRIRKRGGKHEKVS